jgi:hypothetical protein
MYAIEHVDLDCDEWNVEMKSLISTREEIKKLKQEGGYRLTHLGEIQRADQTPFTGRDADGYLHALRFFLSFAKGGWCEPICAVGFDASGNRVWESWSSPRDPWRNPLSWFDPHNGSQISSLFPGFMKRWASEDWPIFASGGLRTGVDITKCLALGATLGGMAGVFLKAANQNIETTINVMKMIVDQIRISMFATGSKNLKVLNRDKIQERN